MLLAYLKNKSAFKPILQDIAQKTDFIFENSKDNILYYAKYIKLF